MKINFTCQHFKCHSVYLAFSVVYDNAELFSNYNAVDLFHSIKCGNIKDSLQKQIEIPKVSFMTFIARVSKIRNVVFKGLSFEKFLLIPFCRTGKIKLELYWKY